MNPTIEPLGDSAAIIAWRMLNDTAAWQIVQNATAHLDCHRIEGVLEIAPAFRSLTVYYDCHKLAWTTVAKWIDESMRSLPVVLQPSQRTVEIPVCYADEFALDLAVVAEVHKLSTAEVVRLHCTAKYTVQMIGFSPGFPYLAGLPSQLHTARRASPRLLVPIGSVAIGGKQTGIYSLETPGGWHIIGRTPLRLFDPGRDNPCLLTTGDCLRFVSIDRQQFDEYPRSV